MEPNWLDLQSRGFLVIHNFLTEAERELLLRDYESPRAVAGNSNYDLKLVGPEVCARFEPRLQSVTAAVHSATGIEADLTTAGLYFAIERGVNFAWHQDHESYFLFQEHYHYLNFYIPIIKPDPQRTNLCVVPFDSLRASVPEFYERLVGGGATRFAPDGGRMAVTEDESAMNYVLPVDFERLAVAPELVPGDLLLLRGDMIHRTQDTSTERVAVSFRRQSAKAIVRRDRFLGGGPAKRTIMWKNIRTYSRALQYFSQRKTNELTVGELNAFINNA